MPNKTCLSSCFFPLLKIPDYIDSAESLVPVKSGRADTSPQVTRDPLSWVHLNILIKTLMLSNMKYGCACSAAPGYHGMFHME